MQPMGLKSLDTELMTEPLLTGFNHPQSPFDKKTQSADPVFLSCEGWNRQP